ncbi:MAG: ATP-binding cassette domain-containing protein [Deltaproteobacteria bacterium]|nr:ATP-binding cassette domain-containing protein [Deltaproteobacteria bacterium]
MLYELFEVKKVYGDRAVLDLRELSLEAGRTIGLLGPNGAGKTTLLEVLAFLSQPTVGEIRFQGKRVLFNRNNLQKLRCQVVLVQQQPIMFTGTVWSNVEYPLKIRQQPKKSRHSTVREYLELVGMWEFRNAEASRLSGGETQRVAIARALACSPEVILFDEPTASVDVEHQNVIENIIEHISRSQGISVIFSSHDMSQVSRLAQEIVFLFEGKRAPFPYENIFSGHVERRQDGSLCCAIQSGLHLRLREGSPGMVRLAINPRLLRVEGDAACLPPENTFAGRLLQLTEQKTMVRALVDVGLPISVLIPKQDFSPMRVGEKVWLNFPAESITII